MMLALPAPDVDGFRHVVALSGGKDSTAQALALKEREPREYIYVWTPTGNELPEMVQHVLNLRNLLGRPILPVTSGTSLRGLIEHWKALPNFRQRWCTRVLKLEPYYRFLSEIEPVVSYVGLRADEDSREGMQFPSMGSIKVRFPMREWGWSEADVWSYLDRRGISIPARTDCAWCYHQTLGEWWRLWHGHPELYAEAEALEEKTGHTFRSPGRDTWPADLKSMRELFAQGHVPRGTVTTDDLFQGGRRKTMCRVCSL